MSFPSIVLYICFIKNRLNGVGVLCESEIVVAISELWKRSRLRWTIIRLDGRRLFVVPLSAPEFHRTLPEPVDNRRVRLKPGDKTLYCERVQAAIEDDNIERRKLCPIKGFEHIDMILVCEDGAVFGKKPCHDSIVANERNTDSEEG